MDDVRVGSIIRAVRVRRGLRQTDVAAMSGVSRTIVSEIERGGLEQTSLRAIRQAAMAVGVSLPFAPRWRGADLAQLLDERHAALARVVVAELERLGWQVLPEHTFSVFGERGSIDVLGWHSADRAVLVVEVKTRIVDLQDLLSTLDRKRRLAPRLARDLGWNAVAFGAAIVVPEETQVRNAVAAHKAVFSAAYPADTWAVRRWLRLPAGDLRGIWFVRNFGPGDAKGRMRGSMRVRRPGSRSISPRPRSAK